MKQSMIAIGNFFFKWRNYLFPVFVLLMFVIQKPTAFLSAGSTWLAIFFVAAGILTRAVVIGYAYIKRGGLNKKVYADKLVTEGMFELCRNPLYVGNMLAIIGIFIIHGDPLVIFIGIIVYAFIYQSIIYAEEAYLQNKFGADFDAYCARVPRWFPVLSRFRSATKDMGFSWKRVLVKDYPSITINAGVLALIAYYRQPSTGLAVFIAACLVFVAGVNFAKRSGKLKLDQ